MVKTCNGCHGRSDGYKAANLKRCAGCRKVYYCSTACQKYAWVEHMFDCKPCRPINTADYLALAVRQGVLPEHAQTCVDYGFNRTFPPAKPNLLKLYYSLMQDLDIPPKTIHDWRVRGVLVDEIKAAFYKLPERSRGDSFRWFLENEHVVALAGQPLPQQAIRDRSRDMIVRAWQFTGGDEGDTLEEIEEAVGRKPKEVQECHALYRFLLSGAYPSPHLHHWVNFGFPSCASVSEEVTLGFGYMLLIAECTFEAFCEAYRARRLLDLFDAKGLKVQHRERLRDLLHGVGAKKSVWYLRQCIALEEAIKEQVGMPHAVMVDYGFANCKDDAERRQLMRVYKAFFDKHGGDPLALHEAVVRGDTHGFLSKVVHGLRDPKFQRLMKNPYPYP